jgi:hypothetical protein
LTAAAEGRSVLRYGSQDTKTPTGQQEVKRRLLAIGLHR